MRYELYSKVMGKSAEPPESTQLMRSIRPWPRASSRGIRTITRAYAEKSGSAAAKETSTSSVASFMS